MVNAFKNHVHADMVKNPQYVSEGDILTTPADYGEDVTNPTYIDIDIDGARLVVTSAEERVERRQAGNMGRIGKSTHKERYTANLTFNASGLVGLNGNAALQIWCINESLITDATTAAASFQFLQSYAIGGVETFETLQGCLPTRCQITVGSGHIVYSVDLSVKKFNQSTTATNVIGAGAYATKLVDVPWVASDGGVDHFDYGTTSSEVAEALDNMTITIDRQYGKSSPTEVIQDMFNQETIRNVGGSVAIIVRNSTIIADAFSIPRPTLKSMNIVLRATAGGVTIAITNVTFESPSGRNPDPSSADAWLDSYTFEAESIAASINV